MRVVVFVSDKPAEDFQTTDADAALAFALARVNTGATVRLQDGDGPSFAIRTFRSQRGSIIDSGWQCWVSNEFVGHAVRFSDAKSSFSMRQRVERKRDTEARHAKGDHAYCSNVMVGGDCDAPIDWGGTS